MLQVPTTLLSVLLLVAIITIAILAYKYDMALVELEGMIVLRVQLTLEKKCNFYIFINM